MGRLVKTHGAVLLSGGIDSTACLHLLREKKILPQAIFFDYGQKSARFELEAAKRVSRAYSVPLRRLDLKKNGQFGAGEIQGRNAVLIFGALMFGNVNSGLLALGIHAGTKFYDCSPSFVRATSGMLSQYSRGQVKLFAPFLTWSKKDIFELVKLKKVPVEITYSCERGIQRGCGVCESCISRKGLGC